MSHIPEGYKLAVDISYYQWNVDYQLLAKYVDLFIIRMQYGADSDPRYKYHVENAVKTGKAVASYAWFRPDQSMSNQLSLSARMKSPAPNVEVNFIFSDQEQHGQGGWRNHAPIYSHNHLATVGLQHVQGLENIGYRAGVYSRSTWIQGFARPMVWGSSTVKAWLYDRPVWMASYPFASGRISTTWEYLIDFYAPIAFKPYFVSDWPASKKYSDLWQWSGDKFQLPGVLTDLNRTIPVDLNYVSDALLKEIKTGAPEPPPPPPPYENWRCRALLGMVVRETPGGKDTGKRIKYNEYFKVYEKKYLAPHTWGKISPDNNEWIALTWSVRTI